MRQQKIVLLCTEGDSTRAVYGTLRRNFDEITVIMEEHVSRRQLLRGRLKKAGAMAVGGQVLFMLLVMPLLRRAGRHRVREIQQQYDLDQELPENIITRVSSVNSDEARRALQTAQPAVVVVNGTRIINRQTLECTNAVFINMHAGITPLYRGVHGAYWALSENRPELVGTTVHLVDTGIDTGNIVEQSFFAVTEGDNFATYPHLHTAAGLPALVRAVAAALDGTLRTTPGIADLDSKLRYHPTIWQYLRGRRRHRAR